MTYNIHHGAGYDGVLDLERIAVLIEKSGADVIGLQEVDRHWSERSNWVDQPAWLAKRLKMHYGYAANLEPQDFHGFFEAYLGTDWYLFDATRMAPLDGLVRIGSGRDGASSPTRLAIPLLAALA